TSRCAASGHLSKSARESEQGPGPAGALAPHATRGGQICIIQPSIFKNQNPRWPTITMDSPKHRLYKHYDRYSKTPKFGCFYLCLYFYVFLHTRKQQIVH